ncbi:hypothetical protein ABE099_15415 [Paenibacillus turicensis]|uniref:hypothetical protein n=1 Tax=Paenibacillus turicensis TaxID=160487 RepID=UPI003D2E3FD4
MRKPFFLLCLFLLSTSLLACSEAKEKEMQPEKKIYTGYLSLEGNKLLIDDFEFISSKDKARIKELGLNDMDMPNGYYIHNETDELKTFILDENTSYMFFDSQNLFVKEEDDKKYTTKSLDEFKTYLNPGGNDPNTIPFEIETQGEKVISIKEIYVP